MGEKHSRCLAPSTTPGLPWFRVSPGPPLGLHWGPWLCKTRSGGNYGPESLCEPGLGDLEVGPCSCNEALRAIRG